MTTSQPLEVVRRYEYRSCRSQLPSNRRKQPAWVHEIRRERRRWSSHYFTAAQKQVMGTLSRRVRGKERGYWNADLL